jgi:hypothetical protein
MILQNKKQREVRNGIKLINHYCLALHNLPPLEVQEEEPNADYDFKEPKVVAN